MNNLAYALFGSYSSTTVAQIFKVEFGAKNICICNVY